LTTAFLVGGCYHSGTRHWKTEVVATSVEMLSGRRKKDYQADALATQAAAETTTDESAISPNEAAEVGVRTVPDEAADEQPSDDEEVLVLA
jgi:hypothetical protein